MTKKLYLEYELEKLYDEVERNRERIAFLEKKLYHDGIITEDECSDINFTRRLEDGIITDDE